MNSWKAKRPPAWDLKALVFSHCNLGGECLPSVENVHEWDRKDVWLLGSGKVRDVNVERNLL